ncbi:MAG: hypothetical protein WCR16_04255 [Bacilli bacterium]|jgi:transcription elongation factor Elf1
MNTLCPKCGKDNTSTFVDTKLKTHGFFCEDCKKDFGVDDGTALKKKEEDLLSFTYDRSHDGEKKTFRLVRDAGKATLTIETEKDKKRDVYEPIDFTPYVDSFLSLLFEKLFVLDWPETTNGFLVGKDPDTCTLTLLFKDKSSVRKSGFVRLPVYSKALDEILDSLLSSTKEE